MIPPQFLAGTMPAPQTPDCVSPKGVPEYKNITLMRTLTLVPNVAVCF